VPFVAKATGVPLAMVASRVMVGATLAELRVEGLLRAPKTGGHVSVKEAVLPFSRFPEVDPVLGPEMRSTGEVMGIDRTFGVAYAKSQLASSNRLPSEGTVYLSVNDRDKAATVGVARSFANAGLRLVATSGTAVHLAERGIPIDLVVRKISDPGDGPTALDLLRNGGINLVINTPRGTSDYSDGADIRRACTVNKVPMHTTLAAAVAAASGIADWKNTPFSVRSLQEWLA
jgi:carbamoyl-phosphate synthase large subunit